MSVAQRVEALVARLPDLYPGPGGAVAVIKDGSVLTRSSWGYTDLERHIPFTSASAFRICSITKQFTCALLLSHFPDPDILNDAIARRLPRLRVPHPTIRQLAHNQSGLRDYWAIGMLLGALPETPFSDDDARNVISATQNLQFEPGTSYSYCNQNFRLIGDILSEHLNEDFSALLQRHVANHYGMNGAFLAADTTSLPDGGSGYEGNPAMGYIPAQNRILWTGDAGMAATLDDMIAWELYIDRTREDAVSIYNRLSELQHFSDGTPAPYGFGLRHFHLSGRKATGHGGGLRGWHSFRLHIPHERLSVVVLFNHMSDASGAAIRLAREALDISMPQTGDVQRKPLSEGVLAEGVLAEGVFLDDQTGLSAEIRREGSDVKLHYLYPPERCPRPENIEEEPFRTRLTSFNGTPVMHRPTENREVTLRALQPFAVETSTIRLEGIFFCQELESWLEITGEGYGVYGAFQGYLGKGQMAPLRRIAQDVLLMPCRRALDHAPPGDWTIQILETSNVEGQVEATSLQIGCWLARKLYYKRVNAMFDRRA